MELISKGSRLSNQFRVLFWLTQATGIITCVLITAWVFHYRGGVGWRSEPSLEFNWHTLSFTFGMVYLYGNGMIVFRFLPWLPKKQLKLIHTGIHTGVIISMCFGMFTVIDCYSGVPNKHHFVSMHSWLGILSMLAFVIQWAVGIYMYLYPGAPSTYSVAYMPLHIFLGVATFICTIATALLGFFAYTNTVKNFQDLPPESLILNSISLLLVLFTSLIAYILYKSTFKYKHTSNECKPVLRNIVGEMINVSLTNLVGLI